MAKPRTPTKKARVSGATLKDPARFKGRKEPANPSPIGAPYKGMTPAQVKVWKECAENMPWLSASHRLLLRQVSILAARMETDPEVGVSAMHALSAMLSKLGATPTDESKVDHPDGDVDPDDKFFH
ncbi:hypothetical protein ABB27_11935 [Stenotrophomonas terrae]|uniref:Terminase n=1 Tax=Stenotrophomonas terrae TaxID=405446 RepID=A0A0R0CCJ4_9GAMM|nr:hypothetical protein [Stenotrophomonas terrae]KRG66981.1 hypothetical protein ABB27_11935 [Stenotrophomonas terrae]